MKKEDIEVKIKKLQALVDNPNVSENDKKNYREGIKQYEAKLPVEKKETTAKPVAKPASCFDDFARLIISSAMAIPSEGLARHISTD